MKADGTGKTELRELWHQPAYPIDTQTQATWISVNLKTHKIALSITLAGSDITGLWTMNLDGSDLQRTITPYLIEGHRQSINFPSWTPDGQCIVFSESFRGTQLGGIARCDQHGKHPEPHSYMVEEVSHCLFDHCIRYIHEKTTNYRIKQQNHG